MSINVDHSIKALAIHCIDYRFVEIQRKFLDSKGLEKNYDLIAYPGASKNIAKVKEAIEISVKLHNPKKILIIDHVDCGAFAAEDSRENHIKSLNQAVKDLSLVFPDKTIEIYLSNFKEVEKI